MEGDVPTTFDQGGHTISFVPQYFVIKNVCYKFCAFVVRNYGLKTTN